MSGFKPLSGGGDGGGSIAKDMYFADTTARDTFTTNNPSRITQGIACAVVNGTAYDYYQWDEAASQWREANEIYQGEQGPKGDSGGSTVNAQENELTTYDQASETFLGTGVFAENGEITAETNTFNLGGAWAISSSGDVVAITNKVKNESYRVNVGSFSKLGNPEDIVNREVVQNFNPNTIYSDEITNLVFPNIPITPINQSEPEAGHIAEYLDFRLGPNSVKTNITISTYISGVLFDSTKFETVNEIETGIYRFYFKTPIVYAVGDTIRTETTSTDGNVTMMGDLSTMKAWVRFNATLFDIKDSGLKDDDVESVDLSVSGGVLTTELTKYNGTTVSDSVNISGSKDVVELDVSDDSTVTLNSAYVGKFVNIVQTGVPTAIPMAITLSDHSTFSTGDVITIAADDSYVNYYFAVYYNDKTGRQLVRYPSRKSSITLVRTDNSWDINQDGTFTKVAVRPKSSAGSTFSEDDPTVKPVQAFSFIDHPAVNYIEDNEGNRVVEIDLNKIINVNPSTVDIVGWWSDNAAPDSSDILNALGQIQSATLISHTDNIKSDELPVTTIAMRREETSPKYTYFAYPSGFFTDNDGAPLEPTLVNTGVGNSPDWVVSTVDVDGVTYRIQRSPAQNVSQQLLTCKLIQEGY